MKRYLETDEWNIMKTTSTLTTCEYPRVYSAWETGASDNGETLKSLIQAIPIAVHSLPVSHFWTRHA